MKSELHMLHFYLVEQNSCSLTGTSEYHADKIVILY